MKKVIYSLIAGAMMLASCSDFTELQPKGKNLLSTTNDLELLLNCYCNGEYPEDNSPATRDIRNLGGDVIYTYSDAAPTLSLEPRPKNAYLWGFLDSEDDITRFELLTTSDSYYEGIYSWIGTIANPILSQLDMAKGPEDKKAALKAEALTLRAYGHLLILQKFSKAYNPATAANDPAIVYLRETDDIQTPQPKKTVQEAYELALEDINAAIATNAMPKNAINGIRFNKAAMYAVKAHICMNMAKYDEAKEAAKLALAENNFLYDYYANIQELPDMSGGTYKLSMIDCLANPENYSNIVDFCYFSYVVPEAWNSIEPGYAVADLFDLQDRAYGPEAFQMYASMGYLTDLDAAGWKCASSFNEHINLSGLTSPFMYLYMAECEVRAGNIDAGMEWLDKLRSKRLDPATYAPLKGAVTTKADAIAKIKQTSFGENIWSGWNFMQRKRWNVEVEWETTLTRTIAGKTYTLSPKSNLWVFPFPNNVRGKNANLTSNRNN